MSINSEWIINKNGERIYPVSHAKAIFRGDSTVDKDIQKLEQDTEILKQGSKALMSYSTGSPITLDDACDASLINLKLYGKSVQDGTPTPENPVDIVSVGDSGAVDITACGKNLLNPTLQTKTKNGVTCTNNGDGTYTLNGTAQKGTYFSFGAINNAVVGTNYRLTCSPNPSKSTYIAYFEVGASGYEYSNSAAIGKKIVATIVIKANVTVNNLILKPMITTDLTATYDDFEPYKGTTATITSSLPLCGIPVAIGGNYTDSTGQMQCCDELVYNADGTGKIIKHVGKIVFNGGDSEQWIQPNINAEFTNDFRIQHKLQNTLAAKLSTIKTELICSRLPFNYSIWSSDILGCHIAQNGDFVLRMPSSVVGGTDAAAFKTWLASNPLTVIYQLAEPQEINLTTAEMSALRSLQTFEGLTNISNSAEAEMSVKYWRDETIPKLLSTKSEGSSSVDYPASVTMYVDSTNGNDDNEGTQEAPLATITKALEKIPKQPKAGSGHIYIANGSTIDEQVNISGYDRQLYIYIGYNTDTDNSVTFNNSIKLSKVELVQFKGVGTMTINTPSETGLSMSYANKVNTDSTLNLVINGGSNTSVYAMESSFNTYGDLTINNSSGTKGLEACYNSSVFMKKLSGKAQNIMINASSFSKVHYETLDITRGTISANNGEISENNAQHCLPGTDYTKYKYRNISLGTSSTPPKDANFGGNGSIYFYYHN